MPRNKTKSATTTIAVDRAVVKKMKVSAILVDMTLGEYVEYLYVAVEKNNGK